MSILNSVKQQTLRERTPFIEKGDGYSDMKRVFAALLAATVLALMTAAGAAADTSAAEKSRAIRLHVIANSDSFEDQRIKLEVRDAVLECMAGFEGVEGRDRARTLLFESAERIEAAASSVLSARGAEYSATLYFGNFEFPERTYGGTTYPAGEYEALRIVLGEGAGQNWWCVMFPPLCVIDCGTPASFDESGRLEFRSFLYELWRGIFK